MDHLNSFEFHNRLLIKDIWFQNKSQDVVKDEYDNFGNLIYQEREDGTWERWYYDNYNKLNYFENSDSYWKRWIRNDKNEIIRWEDSEGSWKEFEYDSQGYCLVKGWHIEESR